ncbi:cation:proton antiporter [Streptomyces sp. NPDC048281]|uniref:cation:proton antiporter domain-containing protein n=1 Tax=Streptomyces sp. NPDC048281 TaxID=3154715 RepID=UPI00344612BF
MLFVAVFGVALPIAVLLSGGRHVSFAKLRANRVGPARALGPGMPPAFVFMALVTHWLVGRDRTTSFLVGAVLAPAGPVFASAIVGRKEAPARLREFLDVESGVNDGLALPVVPLLITAAGPTAAGHTDEAPIGRIALELELELGLGVAFSDDEPDHADPPAEVERKTAV